MPCMSDSCVTLYTANRVERVYLVAAYVGVRDSSEMVIALYELQLIV